MKKDFSIFVAVLIILGIIAGLFLYKLHESPGNELTPIGLFENNSPRQLVERFSDVLSIPPIAETEVIDMGEYVTYEFWCGSDIENISHYFRIDYDEERDFIALYYSRSFIKAERVLITMDVAINRTIDFAESFGIPLKGDEEVRAWNGLSGKIVEEYGVSVHQSYNNRPIIEPFGIRSRINTEYGHIASLSISKWFYIPSVDIIQITEDEAIDISKNYLKENHNKSNVPIVEIIGFGVHDGYLCHDVYLGKDTYLGGYGYVVFVDVQDGSVRYAQNLMGIGIP